MTDPIARLGITASYRRMRVLHLYSDWKWTGPAEPTVNLIKALGDRGIDVVFACRKPPENSFQSVENIARNRGLNVTTSIHLNRYLDLRETSADLRFLRKYLQEAGVQLVHCHLAHDHFLGGWAAKVGKPRIPVIRTNHKGVPLKDHLWNKWLIGRWADALVEFSNDAAQANSKHFNLPRDRICRVDAAIDLDRFDPEKVERDLRPDFGFSSEDVVVGIVARMQRHRRFHVFFEAIAWVRERFPSIKVLVLGKGTHMQKVAVEPVRRLDLTDHVVFGGYRKQDYREALACFDLKVFLVPGSDGTCRAVREAMAMGKPVVAARRGMLPEIVEHERTGLVVDDSARELGEAILKLAVDPDLRRTLGTASRRKAVNAFSLELQAEQIAGLYESLLRLS